MSDGLEAAAWREAQRYTELIEQVRIRLTLVGGIEELRVLQGMSAQELDVLVERERW